MKERKAVYLECRDTSRLNPGGIRGRRYSVDKLPHGPHVPAYQGPHALVFVPSLPEVGDGLDGLARKQEYPRLPVEGEGEKRRDGMFGVCWGL